MQNIIDRSQADPATQESEERLRMLFETMAQGVVYQDASGQIISANPAAERILGLTLDQMKGRTSIDPRWLAIQEDGTDFHGEQHPAMVALRTGEKVHGVVMGVYNPTEEDTRWILINAVPLFHPGEARPNQVYTTFEDITERKRAEASLRYQAELLAAMKDAVIATDRRMQITSWNEAAEHIYGWKAGEVIGRRLSEVLPTDFPGTTWEAVIAAMVAGQDFQGEVKQQRKDAAWIPIESIARALRDKQGLVTGFVGVNRDITERMRAENELRTQKEILQKIFDHIPVMINLISEDGSIRLVNRAWERTLGWSLEEIQRHNLDILVECYPDPQVREGVLNFLSSARKEWGDFKTRVRDGRVIDTSWTEIRLSDGTNIGIGQDITERKQAEEQLRGQMEENLKRTRELEAVVDISAAMRQTETRPEMMAVLLEQTIKAMEAQAGALGLLNGSSLVFQAVAGQAIGWEGRVLSQGQNLIWEVLRDGCPKFLDGFVDAPADSASSKFLELVEDLSPGIRAGIVLPLKSGAATIGVLLIGFSNAIQVSNTYKRVAAAIADMAGSALHRMSIADSMERLVADRTRELETIYKVTAAASKPGGLGAALRSALDPILKAAEAQIGVILLVDDRNGQFRVLAEEGLLPEIKNEIESADRENSLEGWVLKHKQPLLIPDLTADPRVNRSGKTEAHIPFTALPMRVGERIVGILEIARLGGSQFDMEELTLLSFIADHLGLVIENAHLVELAEQNAVLEERSRLARELHDSVTQTLYSLNLFAGAGKNLAASHNLETIREHFMTIEGNALQALKEMRLLIYELRPAVLDEEGLIGALQKRLDAVERRSAMKVNLIIDENLMLSDWMEVEIYRIAQEVLNNVLKHAHASRVDVSLKSESEVLIFKIVDDGVGFDLELAQNQGGQGLASLRERVKKINGLLTISSSGQRGTEVRVEVKR